MKRFLFPALVSISLLGFGAFAAPQPATSAKPMPAAAVSKKSQAPTTHKMSGTIVSATDNSLVIKTKKGEEMTFTMNDKTTRPSEIKAGEAVQVRYVIENGSNTAAKVVVRTALAKPKKGGSSGKD